MLPKNKLIALDTETVSLEDKTLICFSYSYLENGDNQITKVVPVAHNKTKNMFYKKALKLLIDLISNNTIIFHNSSFDIPVLVKFGVPFELFENIEDTLIMANLVDENVQHGLKPMTKQIFDKEMTELKAICGTGKSRVSIADVDWDITEDYSFQDAYWTLRLYYYLYNLLEADEKVYELYEWIEKPLLKVVADMHINGINIDVRQIKDISKTCKEKMDLLEYKLKIAMGGKINFNSSQQLKKYFIDKCKLPVLKTSEKTGAPSMDKQVLEKYAEMNNEAKMLLDYKKCTKLYSTFIPALTPNEWDLDTWRGKIFASFRQAGTTSGRFSSSNPNMQNIPRKDTDEFRIRRVVVADKGHVLIGADYSQIELRVLAHFSQDPNLLRAYQTEVDIHTQTANFIGVERQMAKTINFGLVYSMGAKTLAEKLKIPFDQAQMYLDKFFELYSGVTEFWENTKKVIENRGFVETAFGRKRRRSKIFFVKDDYEQGAEIRSMTNAIVQGTAADLMKRAMLKMYPRLKKYGARLVSTVHDEVIVSTPIDKAKEVFEIVKQSMIEDNVLSVPIEVDVKFGRTWEECHGDGIKLEDLNDK